MSNWKLAERVLARLTGGRPIHPSTSRRVILVGTIACISALALASSYVRDLTLTSTFGLTRTLDVYLLALAAPQLVGLEAGNVAVALLLPRYAAVAAHPQRGAVWGLRRDGIVWASALLGLTASMALLATPLATIVAAGLEPDGQAQVVWGIRVMSPLVLLFGLAGIGRAWLDAHGKLWVGATFPMVRSLTIAAVVLGLWFFRPARLADAVLGALLGAALACAWSIIMALRDAGPLGDIQTTSPRTSHSVRDVITITTGSVVSQSADIVDKSLASHLGPGQVSALSVAYSLIQIPTALFVSASTTVAFPEFAKLRAVNAQHDIRVALSGYWKLAVLTLTPVVLVAVLIPHQIVAAAFGVKRLGFGGVALTASCFAALAIGQLPYVTALIERQYLLAGSRYGLTTLSALLSIATKIGASLILVRVLGVIGLALATSIGHMMSLALLSALTSTDLRRVRIPREADG